MADTPDLNKMAVGELKELIPVDPRNRVEVREKTEAALRIEVIPGRFSLGPFMRTVSMIGSEPDGTR